MSAPVAIRQNYSDLFGANMLPVLEELFRAELEMHPSRREQLFKVVSHDRDIWQATELHDLELFENVEEGSEYSFKRPKQGASKTLTIDKFGLGFSVSEEMVEDAKFEVIADMVRKLARSARESQEIQAMNIFNNGFSSETTSDGQPIFDLAHTLPSGLTYRNELATASDLSVTSLDTALSDFETQFIGDSGIIYNIQPKMLVVHPSQKRFAKELIGSDLKVNDVSSDNGATNAMNSFKQDGLIVISSPHLTDEDAWFLTAMPSETGLRIVSRKGIETKAAGPDVGFSTDSILYKARYREAIGATTAYGVYGSPGA